MVRQESHLGEVARNHRIVTAKTVLQFGRELRLGGVGNLDGSRGRGRKDRRGDNSEEER